MSLTVSLACEFSELDRTKLENKTPLLVGGWTPSHQQRAAAERQPRTEPVYDRAGSEQMWLLTPTTVKVKVQGN